MPPASITKREWAYLPEFAQEQLPRYTSYPPANRFSDAVGPEAAAAALGGLPAGASISLYLHIPFCQKLCWYCGCHTSVPTHSDPVDTYLDALKTEIANIAKLLPAGAAVGRVHLGGGSPDIMTPDQISDLFAALRSSFTLSRRVDIAAELDPRNLSPDVVQAFARQGLSRASLGVQTLDEAVQRRINRIQSKADIETAVVRLRAAGVSRINFDLMYGLPGQTRQHVVDAAMFAATQDIDRVAVFGYAHVPWMKKHQKGIFENDLPSGEARFRQAEVAAETLERAGYLAIGFDHFSAPGDSLAIVEQQGRLRRNFQGYTDDNSVALIGLGASAISSLPGLIYQNTPSSAAYRAAQTEGKPAGAVVRGTTLSAEDKRIGRLIERILCDFEADIPSDLRAAASAGLERLRGAGIVEMHGSHFVVTDRGRPYVRNAAACFDPAFAPASNRHSLAI